MDLNERLRNLVRPTWRGDETFERFTAVSNASATALTVPDTATGCTFVSRDPTDTTGIYILPTGNSLSGPRILIDGGASAERRFYMSFKAGSAPPLHILGETSTQDVDVFYHYD